MRTLMIVAAVLLVAPNSHATKLTFAEMAKIRSVRLDKTKRALKFLEGETKAAKLPGQPHLTQKDLDASFVHLLRAKSISKHLFREMKAQFEHKSYQELFSNPKQKFHFRIRDGIRLYRIDNRRQDTALMYGLTAASRAMSGLAKSMGKMTAKLRRR